MNKIRISRSSIPHKFKDQTTELQFSKKLNFAAILTQGDDEWNKLKQVKYVLILAQTRVSIVRILRQLTMFKVLVVMPNFDACCDLLCVNII